MEEIWKDIAGYGGKYSVSNLGNVRSMDWRGTGKVQLLTKKISNAGYYLVHLSDGKSCKLKTVHRLVAEAFIPNESNLSDVNHIDENRLNNNVDNLEWCTHKSNVQKFNSNHPDHFRSRRSTEKYVKRLNLKVNQYSLGGDLIRTWDNSRTVFVTTGMSDWSISRCCRGQQKTAYGYIWRYAN